MIRSSNISQLRAQDYLNRVRVASGAAISAAERLNLVAWYQGLADLSITPVEAWTFRSGQSCGTGATAPGLYGAYAGTLVNGPTWGTTGIEFAVSASQTITATIPYPAAAVTMIGCVNIKVSGQQYRVLENAGDTGTWLPFSDGNYYFDYPVGTARLSGSGGVSLNAFSFNLMAGGAANQKVYKNGSLLLSSGNTMAATGNIVNIYKNYNAGNSVLAFAALISTDQTANQAAIYALYKATIGKDLSLP